MRGYDSTSYGDGFADVYDDWYGDVTDVDATVALVHDLAGPGGRVLELGAGTGRLALPIAVAGHPVVGVDASAAMLDVLRTRLAEQRATAPGPDGDGAIDVRVIEGDMVDDLPDEEFAVVLVAYNTLFNLLDADTQRSCFAAATRRLGPNGRFVVEAIVPDPEAPAGADVTVRSMTADRVVLTVSDHRPDEQRTEGQFVELTEAGGVRLRPWVIRWCDTAELDAMAADAGLTLEHRWSDMNRSPFDDGSDTHVSVYRHATV
ncbi:MAG: class I SAM-dependent methyltransferase [Actinomycetota bacterium]